MGIESTVYTNRGSVLVMTAYIPSGTLFVNIKINPRAMPSIKEFNKCVEVCHSPFRGSANIAKENYCFKLLHKGVFFGLLKK